MHTPPRVSARVEVPEVTWVEGRVSRPQLLPEGQFQRKLPKVEWDEEAPPVVPRPPGALEPVGEPVADKREYGVGRERTWGRAEGPPEELEGVVDDPEP